MQAFKRIYSSLSQAPLFYCLGASHDLYWGSESEKEFIAKFRKYLGEENFVFDVDVESIAKGNRHAVINGYLDKVPVDKVKEYEILLYEKLEHEYTSLLERLEGGFYDAEDMAELKKALGEMQR